MRRVKLSKSVIFGWAISYLVMLIIPVAVFFYGTMITSRLVHREVSRSNSQILDNICRMQDDHMLSLYNAFQYAFTNQTLNKLAASSQKDSTFYNNVESLQRSLRNFYITNNNIGILIYLHKPDYIISYNTSNELTPIYHMQRTAGLKADKQTWREKLSSKYSNYFFADDMNLGSIKQHLVYGHTVRMSGHQITIFATLPFSNLDENARMLHGSTLFIVDREGGILASFGDKSAFDSIGITLTNEESVIGEDGRRYVVTLHDPSPYSGWYYALATPEEDYWKVLKSINTLFIGAIAASLLLGVVTATFLLRRNYRPLRNITKMLRDKGGNKDEYELIAASYRRLVSENTSIRGQLDEQSAQLVERYILSRLKGRRSTLSSADTNTYYQIETEGKTYCLVAFSVESSAGSGNDEKSESELEILLYSLENAVTETLGKYSFYKAEDGRELLYLLYMDDAELTQWNTEKLETMTFIKNFFHNRLSTSIAIAISDTTNDFEQISELYSDAMRALEYKSVTGYEGVILVEDCKQMLEGIYQNTQWIGDLVGAVTRGDYSQIQEITNGLFARRAQEGLLPLSVFRIELNECMYNVLKTYSSVITDNNMHQTLVSKIIDLMTSEDIGNMKAVFLDALCFACDAISRNSKGVTSSFINQVRQFINEYYTDYNLNISLIADRFSKNPNYLSQVYYAQAGQGLLDTIHEVRIERAKELLQNSSFTIEQVAQAVGFSNTRTFRRIFLKRCGVNPSQYKTNKAT